MSAIKVIRDNTHRILSLYSYEHDAAYVSHRCLLSRPEDAEVFATELMAATFEDLMRGNEAITKSLCCDVLSAWVDTKCHSIPDTDLNINSNYEILKINNSIRKEWLKNGITKWLHTNLSLKQGKTSNKTTVIESWERHTAKSVLNHFSNGCSPQDEFSRQASFARLTSHAFADAININASTFLGLGSILRSESNEYYMCIQPLCDCVRLKPGSTSKFLFLKLEKKEVDWADGKDKRFDLLVTDGNPGDIFLKVAEHISNIDVFQFVPPAGNDRIIMKIGEAVHAKQNETTDINFTFLAQLRSSQAQRISMRFLHKLTRIGLDESEWLRRHGTA